MDVHAERVARAFAARDFATLVEYADPEELKSLDIDAADAAKALELCVGPRLEGWTLDKETPDVRVGASGAQGLARLQFTRGSRRAEMVFDVEPTNHGPKAKLMGHIARAWELGYQLEHPIGSPQAFAQAMRLGLAQDRTKLEQLRIYGMTKYEPGAPLIGWDALDSRWRDRSATTIPNP